VAGKCERRQSVRWEYRDLQHLDARARPRTAGQPGLVGNPDHARRVLLADVKNPDEPSLFDFRTDLLPAFARGPLPWALVIVDETTG
jgi:hypothetical protein